MPDQASNARQRTPLPTSLPTPEPAPTSVHPVVLELVLAAVLWFLAIVWIAFAKGVETDLALVIVTLFFAFFTGLFLFLASYGRRDPRWSLPKTNFREFLSGTVSTATGNMRGCDVLIEIAIMPLALALAATLIGIAWMVVH
jgi:ABC-type amino acid transport system permease subunit